MENLEHISMIVTALYDLAPVIYAELNDPVVDIEYNIEMKNGDLCQIQTEDGHLIIKYMHRPSSRY